MKQIAVILSVLASALAFAEENSDTLTCPNEISYRASNFEKAPFSSFSLEAKKFYSDNQQILEAYEALERSSSFRNELVYEGIGYDSVTCVYSIRGQKVSYGKATIDPKSQVLSVEIAKNLRLTIPLDSIDPLKRSKKNANSLGLFYSKCGFPSDGGDLECRSSHQAVGAFKVLNLGP
jgi:hypothetical protein